MLKPYSEEGLLPYEEVMKTIPGVVVNPKNLIPTQDFVVINRILMILDGKPIEGPDPYPHVVDYMGSLYIHNGHHRWLIALVSGKELKVRIQKGQHGGMFRGARSSNKD
jgi:hypothetical protein